MPMSFGKPCGWFGDKCLICQILALLRRNHFGRSFLHPVRKQQKSIGVLIDRLYLSDSQEHRNAEKAVIMMAILALGMVLDALFGEPNWLWSRISHPVVLIGKLITLGDQHLNRPPWQKAKGAAFLCTVLTITCFLSVALIQLGPIVETLLVAILVAQKSLVDHVGAVAVGLRRSLADGKTAVSLIVGRDTIEMDEAQVTRAAIESAAENFSDGVVAPIFWYMLAGLPGLIMYKAVNTADSMIGYKTEKHIDFGWAAACFDDLLNFIPARLSAVLLSWSAGNLLLKGWRDIVTDARLHRSPNAGWPEAAMARALQIALAGPRSYNGARKEFAWVNKGGNKHANANDIERAVSMLWSAWVLCFLIVVALFVI